MCLRTDIDLKDRVDYGFAAVFFRSAYLVIHSRIFRSTYLVIHSRLFRSTYLVSIPLSAPSPSGRGLG
ncbi:hypothetical protein ABIA53_000434 [Pseudomonas monsensis]